MHTPPPKGLTIGIPTIIPQPETLNPTIIPAQGRGKGVRQADVLLYLEIHA